MFRAKFHAASYSALSVLALAAATAPEAEAGRCHRRRAARVPRHAIVAPCAPSPAVGYAPTPQADPQGLPSALLDPTVRAVGLANVGGVITFAGN